MSAYREKRHISIKKIHFNLLHIEFRNIKETSPAIYKPVTKNGFKRESKYVFKIAWLCYIDVPTSLSRHSDNYYSYLIHYVVQ